MESKSLGLKISIQVSATPKYTKLQSRFIKMNGNLEVKEKKYSETIG